jgi:O-antigen ligase
LLRQGDWSSDVCSSDLWKWRTWSALLAVMALAIVVLSQSRGGGLTILAVLAAAFAWGFSQWPAQVRRYLRLTVALVGVLAVLLVMHLASAYVLRFKAYFGLDKAQGRPLAEARQVIAARLEAVDRVQMSAAALRAWRTAPWFGIGPGMHQNLWPHFAATADGDRRTHQWPKYPNFAYHSYEVHNDWAQLLEEYGAVGLFLFLVAAASVFGILASDLRAQARKLESNGWQTRGDEPHAFILPGLLAIVCMGIHSLGDFNLQIPATTWLLAAILGLAGSRLGETGATPALAA